MRNRPAPLRGPGRSRPPRPAGAPGAGTAHSDPGDAGVASGTGAARLDELFVLGRQPAGPRNCRGGRVRGLGALRGDDGALAWVAGGWRPRPHPLIGTPAASPAVRGWEEDAPNLGDALGELTQNV